jgi:hypothetical protein
MGIGAGCGAAGSFDALYAGALSSVLYISGRDVSWALDSEGAG